MRGGDVCGVSGEQLVIFGMFVVYGGHAFGTRRIWVGFVISGHSNLEGLKELVVLEGDVLCGFWTP